MISYEDHDTHDTEDAAQAAHHRFVVRMGLALILLLAMLLAGCQQTSISDAGPVTLTGIATTDEPTTAQEPAEAGPEHPERHGAHAATVSRVIDGDTITVVPNETFEANYNCSAGTCVEHSIRLLGIDTPELGFDSGADPQCGGAEATNHLASLLLPGDQGAQILVVNDPNADARDRYGRTLAYIHVQKDEEWSDVGSLQVGAGYASPWYPRGEPTPVMDATYTQLWAQAADEGLGLHSMCEGIGRD